MFKTVIFMETFFLILLVVMIFYRLWTILGTRSEPSLTVHAPKVDVPQAVEPKDDKIEQQLQILYANDKKFTAEVFLKGAVRAFKHIVTTFAQGDIGKLKSLLSPDVYNKFKDASHQRTQRGDTIELEIYEILATFIDIVVESDDILITVQFQSEQMMQTKNAEGECYDNPAGIKATVIDTWVFSKKINDEPTLWRLVKTEIKK